MEITLVKMYINYEDHFVLQTPFKQANVIWQFVTFCELYQCLTVAEMFFAGKLLLCLIFVSFIINTGCQNENKTINLKHMDFITSQFSGNNKMKWNLYKQDTQKNMRLNSSEAMLILIILNYCYQTILGPPNCLKVLYRLQYIEKS